LVAAQPDAAEEAGEEAMMNDAVDLNLLSQVSDCRKAFRVGINDADAADDDLATFLVVRHAGAVWYHVQGVWPGDPLPREFAAYLDTFEDVLQLAELTLARWWPSHDFEEAWASLKPSLESWGRETKGN
jgi:hypothetical protein